jgi:transposase
VVTDIVGQSGRRILRAIVAGETDAEKLAGLGSKRLHCSRSDLIAALTGRITAHHRFMIGQHLDLIEEIERRIAVFDARITELLHPFRDTVERLTTIPGVSTHTAEVILAEIGFDMSKFPTAGHLLSWAGLVPRLDESAGKRRSTRVRKGAPWLKPVLVQGAYAAARKKNSYLQAQFYRLKARRGAKKAAIAVAASVLTAAYHMIKDGTFYRDLGADHLVKHDAAKTAAKLAKRIKDLGYEVQYQAAV